MATGAPLDAAAEELARSEASQDLDPARGQVPLHVRRLTGALDPDCPRHPASPGNGGRST